MRPRVPEGRARRLLLTAALAGLLGIGCGSPARQVERLQPNILLILVDDLRPDLGAYGHPTVRTPWIDRLASEGLRFDRAYVQVPACNPSRASLLTGLRPQSTGVFDNRSLLPADESVMVTLPGWLREHGYYTAAVGKVFHGSGRKGAAAHRHVWDLSVFPRGGGRGRENELGSDLQGKVGRYSWRATSQADAVLQDSKVARRAIEILQQPRSAPLFLAVGLAATHPHFVAPRRFFDLYPLDDIDLPPSSPQLASRLADLHGWSDESLAPLTERERKELVRAYWACVSFLDEQVGRLLVALEEQQLTEDTIVVLVSDHGVHLGEQGWWSKRTLYEASTRVPFVVRAPGVGVTGASSRLVELIDLFPTLLDLVELPRPAALEGRSLVPLLRDPERPWTEAVFSQVQLSNADGRSVRTRDLRYTEWTGSVSLVELFDLSAGQTESVDLSADPARADDRRRLAALLR